MAVETSGESNENFGNVWKHSNDESKIEHKLRCRLSIENDTTTSTVELMDSTTKGRDDLPVNAVSTTCYIQYTIVSNMEVNF